MVPALWFAGSALAGGPATVAGTGSDIVLDDDPSKLREVASGPTVEARFAPSLAPGIAAAVTTPPIGTVKFWYSRSGNSLLRDRPFTLRAITGHSEIWVSNVLSFKTGDCRNDGDRNVITDAQVNYLAGQFENNIYPKESAEFSVPPDRDGTHARRGEPGTPFSLTGGDNYYAGDGNKIVILVDNVRDDNYNDLNNSQGLSYIAGFFSSTINTNLDRNVMTVDSYDWTHRTGANPPNEPVPGNNCTSKPARPFLYEGVFAHEYQHLLEFYESPGESTWANEGLSDFAIALTGYVNPATPITQTGFDSHIQCFLGWLGVATAANPNPRPTSGPENSLTNWSDQGDGEILCDYGAAFTFMLWLSDHYGPGFMSALHRQDLNGLAGLQATLDSFVTGKSAADVIHAWAVTVAADKALDTGVGLRDGSSPLPFQVGPLNADIRWDTTEAYSTPGAPPNGSDYVRLRDANGQPFSARQINSLRFKGSTSFAPVPTKWTVDNSPPLQAGNPAYFGGRADNLDNAMARQVAVPTGSPTLAADMLWSTEVGFDSLYVQVSTDDGKTWTSLGNADTTNTLSPAADAKLTANLPGFNGESTTWKHEVFDLAAYAGKTIYVSFRYITDTNTRGVLFDGVWVDNITLNGAPVGDGTLAGWKSLTEINPVAVNGFTVQLIGLDTDKKTPVALGTVPLNPAFEANLEGGKIRSIIGTQAEIVGVIVTYDEPTELITEYARYQLWANGVLQPGG
ncbi:MAG TPA: choice-of-anchor J domain-containing protein [Gaiellaceae bacterium]|nr:choice-of-anchor J domain-containing protein [Gaiellaceae bacterium]